MNNIENPWEAISYLYGEMSEEEKSLFEAKLQQNPDLKEEVQALKATRSCLKGVKKIEEVPPLPNLISQEEKTALSQSQWWQSPWLQAAVFAMAIMCTAALTGLNMRWNAHEGFSLQFGKSEKRQNPIAEQENSIALENQQALLQHSRLIQQILGVQQDSLAHQLSTFHTVMEKRIQRQMAQFASQRREVSLSDEQFSSIRKELLRENYQLMTDLIEYGAEYQRSYNEQMLNEFAQYLDNQRSQDLQLISVALSDILQQNNIQQQETEILLGQLINHVASD